MNKQTLRVDEGTSVALCVFEPEGAPRARPGDTMAVEIDGLGRLENPVKAETAFAQPLAAETTP